MSYKWLHLPLNLSGSCPTMSLFTVNDTVPKEPRGDHDDQNIKKPVWRNPHLWCITTIMGTLTVLYYLPSILHHMNMITPNWFIFDVPHDLHRNLFFLPVLYAVYKFRTKGVIATVSISTIIFIPHALLISPYLSSLLRPTLFVIILGFSGFLLANSLNGIEERKKLEGKIKEAERLASIYEASGMMGHDLRNPLQTIIGTINLAEETLKTLPDTEKRKLQKYVKSIKEQIWYMNKIVTNLQDYARPLKPKPEDVNVSQMIHQSLSEVKIPKGIEVSTMIPEDLLVSVDPLLMRRVFTNLLLNAVQVLTGGGRLSVKAYKTKSATYISVKDTGIGITEENLSKVFEPLFTTKAQGLGLGLSVCKRLVELHGGEIRVKSKVGEWSIFTVKLAHKKGEG